MIPSDITARHMQDSSRLLAAHALFLVFFLLNVSAVSWLPSGVMEPSFVLMAVYYWAIYRPTLIPPVLCFAVGLLIDILTGMPPGVNAVIFVLTHWIVREQRRFLMGQPYSTMWAVFGFVALLAALTQWFLYGLGQWHWAPPGPVLSGAVLSLCIFPFVTLLLVLIHRILPVASKPYS